MSKTWWCITAGSIVIVGVMVYLSIVGVTQREHTLIKWSPIDNIEGMGKVTMARMFPHLKERKTIVIEGPEIYRKSFVTGFYQGIEKQKMDIQIASHDGKGLVDPTPFHTVDEIGAVIENKPSGDTPPSLMTVKMIKMATDQLPRSCGEKPKEECILIKAQRKWHKKKRDVTQYWFLLQWVARDQYRLFFTTP